MSAEVLWRDDGTPASPRFGDIYHSSSGALAQARHVFLQGCGLPGRWAGAARHVVAETGFGLGLNFLATWAAWRADPDRCARLWHVAVEAWPVSADDIRRASAAPGGDTTGRTGGTDPTDATDAHDTATGSAAHTAAPDADLAPDELAALGRQLADAWPADPQPGFHRLSFEDGRVQLLLCVGDVLEVVRQWVGPFDSVYLDGFSPARNPQMWTPQVFKALARQCRRDAHAATWSVASAVRKALGEAGFEVTRRPGLPPKRDSLGAVYRPRWPVAWAAADQAAPMPADHATPPTATADQAAPPPTAVGPRRALVIGAGLAGAAVSASLARRGWQVCLLDAASQCADGASGLPMGLLAVHETARETALSELTRAGVRLSLAELQRLLPQACGADGDWQATDIETWADGQRVSSQGGARVRPAALVQAWLDEARQQGRLDWRPGHRVAALQTLAPAGLRALDPQGQVLAEADICVLATAWGSAELAILPPAVRAALAPVKGQYSMGPAVPDAGAPSAGEPGAPGLAPRRGDGICIARFLHAGQPVWGAGATYERGATDRNTTPEGHQANLAKLRQLWPEAAGRFEQQLAQGQVLGWSGVRCASTDRLPLVGAVPGDQGVDASTRPGDVPRIAGLYMLAALGSRGLSLAALCAELLAAQLHDEPWPIERSLALALDPGRWVLRAARRGNPAA